MTNARAACRLIATSGLLAAGLLGGCAAPQPTRSQTVAAADLSACRARADEIYNKQNRAEVYRSDTFVSDTRDSPFSVSGLPGITSNGLSGLYQRDNMVSSCVGNSGAAAGEANGFGPSGAASTTAVSPPASR